MIKGILLRNAFASLVVFFCLLTSINALASDPPPVAMLKESTSEMLAMMKSHQGSLKSNPKLLEGEIRRIVVPKFDLTAMAQSVVGRRHWQESSPALQKAFIHEFTDLVISVYSAPLQDYNGDKVQFFPLRENIQGQARIAVQTAILRSTGQRIAVNYSLKRGASGWKVYDFSIEGISMVASYRSQFADVLEAKGMSGLLAQMRVHNRNV
jgi:phospholipid transport system substrate-binding protein